MSVLSQIRRKVTPKMQKQPQIARM